MIIDSHCHIYDEKLNEVRDEILDNLNKTNQAVICCGDSILSSKECIKLADSNKNIFAGVGIHPENVDQFNINTIEELCNLTKNKKVIAIGEVGLDYYYGAKYKEKQIEVLRQQIILASKLNLPIIFHVRDASNDFISLINSLKDKYKIRGVVHSFSGSIETAKIYLQFGFFIGINGILTFKNANKMLDVVKFLPLEKILIETDSPYLTPEPFRGKVNRPEYVDFVANKVAEIKDISKETVINQTAKNAISLFNLNI